MTRYDRLNTRASAAKSSRDRDGRSVEEQRGSPDSLLETYRTLIELRRTEPALTRGSYRECPTGKPFCWAFVREIEGQRLLCAINLADTPCTVEVRVPNRPTSDLLELDAFGYVVRDVSERSE